MFFLTLWYRSYSIPYPKYTIHSFLVHRKVKNAGLSPARSPLSDRTLPNISNFLFISCLKFTNFRDCDRQKARQLRFSLFVHLFTVNSARDGAVFQSFPVIWMKYLEYFFKYYHNSTISLKSLWKMMKIDIQHEYPNLPRTWAWIGFSHLEQVPKAFSVPRQLLHLSLFSLKLTLNLLDIVLW